MHWKTRSAASGRNDGTPSPIAKKEPFVEKLDPKKVAQIRKMLVNREYGEVVGKAAEEPETVRCLAECLCDQDSMVRFQATKALGNASLDGVDISAALPALAKCLGHDEQDIQEKTAEVLGSVVLDEGNREMVLGILVAAIVEDASWHVRNSAIDALRSAAEKGANISAALPTLARCLENEEYNVRSDWSAAWALGEAAEKGADISIALPGLVKCLGDGSPGIREKAASALGSAAGNGVDISVAVPLLAGCLEDADVGVRETAAAALEKAAGNCNGETRIAITKALMGFVNSRWFAANANLNTVAYEGAANAVGRIMATIKMKEAA